MISPFLALLLCLSSTALANHGPFKICVPESAMEACRGMEAQGVTSKVEVKCVAARDRVDCIEKIKQHVADFEVVDPEDMYLAAKMDAKAFSVFSEIRTLEEPEAEFRYDAVAVVRTDANIKDIKTDLKGLKSCHTGIGRNVGYKIPLTKLTKMGILGPLNDVKSSPRENELKALSNFFSKACLVGKWSPHPDVDSLWKSKYSNLCQLCENPDVCDYPDANSGYEGVLNCLTKAGGEIGWTKVIYVKKFFGMAYGSQPAKANENDPALYSYLCPDGTKKPITGPPCTWASRPWQGYIATNQISSELKELSEQIKTLNGLGQKSHADWITKVLALNNATLPVTNTPVDPLKYLEKAKYLDVIEKDITGEKRKVTICVDMPLDMEKCELFAKSAYSRDIRPEFGCVKMDTIEDCMKAVGEKKVTVFVADPREAVIGAKYLRPVLYEVYGKESEVGMVAVVKDGSPIKSIGDLKGKTACLPMNNQPGFIPIVKYLLDNKHITKTHCPHTSALKEFFSNVEQSRNPLECLQSPKSDVAFLPYFAAKKYSEVKKQKLQVICPGGTTKAVEEAHDCDLIDAPPRIVVTSKDTDNVVYEEIVNSMLSASKIFGQHPEYFLLFGEFKGTDDVLFSSPTTELKAVADVLPSLENHKKTMEIVTECQI